MSLEEYTPDLDSSEWAWNTAETQSEKVSEAFKESVKKATAGIKRTKKDEKKAKKYDFLLAWFLVKIIVNKKYDFVLGTLFKSMDLGYSSNFILWILSLINIEVSQKIRELSWKNFIVFEYEKTLEKIKFDDSNLPKKIKERINFWIEDIIDSTTVEYSNLKAKKIISLLKIQTKEITNFTALVFWFFLNELNIETSQEEALQIANFIISEVKNAMEKLKIEEI